MPTQKSNRFWDRYLSLEGSCLGMTIGDKGRSSELMFTAIDHPMAESIREYRKRKALEYCQAYAPSAVPVLKLVIANGANRQESILAMAGGTRASKAKKKLANNRYWYSLTTLLELFTESRKRW